MGNQPYADTAAERLALVAWRLEHPHAELDDRTARGFAAAEMLTERTNPQ